MMIGARECEQTPVTSVTRRNTSKVFYNASYPYTLHLYYPLLMLLMLQVLRHRT